MSARTYMLALKSLDPVKNAIGSKDQALLDALLRAVADDDDFQTYAKDMIMKSPPAIEPGCWNYLVEPLAEHFGLSPKRLPLDDWKQYGVWEAYRPFVDPLVSPAAQKLLQFLESGRPFIGSEIDQDGCMFAWLTADEAELVLSELSAIDADELGELDEFNEELLDEFHQELVESLQETVNGKDALFLGAH